MVLKSNHLSWKLETHFQVCFSELNGYRDDWKQTRKVKPTTNLTTISITVQKWF